MAYRNTNIAPITGNFLDKKDRMINIIDGNGNGAIKVATSEETNTLTGMRFIASINNKVAATSAERYALNTNIVREVAIRKISVLSDGPIKLMIYEEGADITAGTNVSSINYNRTMLIQPSLKIFSSPTASADGTLIAEYSFPANALVNVAENMVLKPKTVYTLKVKNDAIAEANFAMNIEWTESGDLLDYNKPFFVSATVNGKNILIPNTYFFDAGDTITEFKLITNRPLYLKGSDNVVYDGEDAYGTIVISDLALNREANITPTNATLESKEYFIVVGGILVDKDGIDSDLMLTFKFEQNIEVTGYDALDDIVVYMVIPNLSDANKAIEFIETAYPTATIEGSSATVDIISWEDTDTYNPTAAGSYTFTGTLGDLPIGFGDAKDPITTVTVDLVIIEATAFDALADVEEAAVEGGLADADAVIAYLEGLYPTATVTGETINVPIVSWTDTDTYSKTTPGSYTFTGAIGNLPFGVVAAAVPVTTVTVEVIVA